MNKEWQAYAKDKSVRYLIQNSQVNVKILRHFNRTKDSKAIP